MAIELTVGYNRRTSKKDKATDVLTTEEASTFVKQIFEQVPENFSIDTELRNQFSLAKAEVFDQLGHPYAISEDGIVEAVLSPVAVQAALSATVASNVVPINSQSAPPVPATSNGQRCAHGAMTPRSGTSSKGPWSGYFCPLPKGDANQCKPIFSAS